MVTILIAFYVPLYSAYCDVNLQLAKMFLLNIVMLSVTSNKSHSNGCIVILDDYCYC